VLLWASSTHAAPLSSLGLYGQFIFVTDKEVDVEHNSDGSLPAPANSFHGVLQADWHVTEELAANGLLDEEWDGLSIHAKAILAIDGVNVVNRAGLRETPFYNVNGELVANNLAELLAGDFANPILSTSGFDFTGLPGSVSVWTGAQSDGEPHELNCDNWEGIIGDFSATTGNLNGTGTDWLGDGSAGSCSIAEKLYGVMFVPEPSTLGMAAFGVAAVIVWMWRR
jgi:hypothetical protein